MNKQDTIKHVLDLVRKYEYDRYLLTLFTGQKTAQKIWVILALCSELRRIEEITSEPITALIRLTWWRESIEEIYQNKPPRRQPTLQAFHDADITNTLEKQIIFELLDEFERKIESGEPLSDSENSNDIISNIIHKFFNKKTPQEISAITKIIQSRQSPLSKALMAFVKLIF